MKKQILTITTIVMMSISELIHCKGGSSFTMRTHAANSKKKITTESAQASSCMNLNQFQLPAPKNYVWDNGTIIPSDYSGTLQQLPNGSFKPCKINNNPWAACMSCCLIAGCCAKLFDQQPMHYRHKNK